MPVRRYAMVRLTLVELTRSMSNMIRVAALVAATVTTGLVAGVLQLYSHTIMPGLGRTDDRTFVTSFQAIDRAIVNPLFLATFLGAFGCTAAALVLSLGGRYRGLVAWLAVALILYLLVLVITFGIHVPRNDAIKAAGLTDPAAARDRFAEAVWLHWNTVRAIAATGAFGCLVGSLIGYGRLTA